MVQLHVVVAMRPVGFYYPMDPVFSSELLVESEFKFCYFTEFCGSHGVGLAGQLVLLSQVVSLPLIPLVLWYRGFHQTGWKNCSIGPSGAIAIGSNGSMIQ